MGIEETGLEDADLAEVKRYVLDLIKRVRSLEECYDYVEERVCDLEDGKRAGSSKVSQDNHSLLSLIHI